jgi:hypothetical protein
MTAKEIITKKHGKKGLEPMWLTLDIKQIVWLMKEYHKQQLKISQKPQGINQKYYGQNINCNSWKERF